MKMGDWFYNHPIIVISILVIFSIGMLAMGLTQQQQFREECERQGGEVHQSLCVSEDGKVIK